MARPFKPTMLECTVESAFMRRWEWKGSWSGHSVDYSGFVLTNDPDFEQKFWKYQREMEDITYYDEDHISVQKIFAGIYYLSSGEHDHDLFPKFWNHIFTRLESQSGDHEFIYEVDEYPNFEEIAASYTIRSKINPLLYEYFHNIDNYIDLDEFIIDPRFMERLFFDCIKYVYENTYRQDKLWAIVVNSSIDQRIREIALDALNDINILREIKLDSSDPSDLHTALEIKLQYQNEE